ncbi:hypothetical protein DSO57_1032012 [Entomophthora muscae]|uniref:Uncharacterized protein n=1 Tax=Entomophthora muscae TaxID=34485 RepID=A0ACC2SD36_9FUNG|nr:hypothetical protein DSO57_1032012 [Entomophthora muscae]
MKFSLMLTSIPCLLAASAESKDENCSIARDSPKSPMMFPGSKRCYLELDDGNCKALLSAYYFNWKTKKCEKGPYSGCLGCAPFNDKEECESSCSHLMRYTKRKPHTQRKINY